LGWADRVREVLDPALCLPAPCQGALGITARSGDDATLALLAALDDEEARLAVTAERAFLAALSGGCSVPAAALAERSGTGWRLRARVAAPDGSRVLHEEIEGSAGDVGAMGREVAERLLARGGAEILAALRVPPLPLAGRRILVTRPREQVEALAVPLRALGAEVIVASVIRIAAPADTRPFDDALRRLGEYDWLAVTSQNTVARLVERAAALGVARTPGRPRIAAIGSATAEALTRAGWEPEVVAEEFRAEGLVAVLARQRLQGVRMLLPRARDARDILPLELEGRGARVDVVVAYETLPDAEGIAAARAALASERVDAVTFTASSTVRALLEGLGGAEAARTVLSGVTLACIGPITAETLRAAGFSPTIEASPYTIPALVDALLAHYTGATGAAPRGTR
jgi:uroporphyrinogen-III synthase